MDIFKNLNTFEKRKSECDRILKKHPERIPVIVCKDCKEGTLPDIDKQKYLVPKELTLGQFVSGRKDGVSHYILISRKDLKDLLSPREWNAKEQDAWEKYREERGNSEIITTMTRALVKQWK